MRVFDFDGTIYDGESLFDLYLYSARHDPKVFRYIAPVLRYAVRYKLGRATLEQMEYGVGKMTEGYLTELSRSKRVASVEQLVDDFWDPDYARIKPWYQPAVGRCDPHRILRSDGGGGLPQTRREESRGQRGGCGDDEGHVPQLQHQQGQTVPGELYGPDVVIDEFYTGLQIRSADDRHGPARVHGQGEHHHASQVGNNRKQHNVTNNERGTYMSMPLDSRRGPAWRIRERTSSSRRASRATIPCTRRTTSPCPTARGDSPPPAASRPTASAAGWSAQQQLFDRYHGLAVCAHPRDRGHHGPAQGQMGGERVCCANVLGVRSTPSPRTNSKTTTHATGTSRTPIRCTGGRRQANPSPMWPRTVCIIILTSLSRKSDSESVVMVTPRRLHARPDAHHRRIWPTRSSCIARHPDDWKITNCTCLHYTRRDPETGRTYKRCALGADRPARAR